MQLERRESYAPYPPPTPCLLAMCQMGASRAGVVDRRSTGLSDCGRARSPRRTPQANSRTVAGVGTRNDQAGQPQENSRPFEHSGVFYASRCWDRCQQAMDRPTGDCACRAGCAVNQAKCVGYAGHTLDAEGDRMAATAFVDELTHLRIRLLRQAASAASTMQRLPLRWCVQHSGWQSAHG